MTKILVAYASKYHSTAEIAEEIGRVLRHVPGFSVVVQEVSSVGDIDGYEAVVLGSAVYTGQWQPEAAEFLRQHEPELAQRPVWLFSSGPTGSRSVKELTHGWTLPEGLRPIAKRIAPRDIAVFHGEIKPESLNDPASLSWGQRLILKTIHPPIGDFRDWNMIWSWAHKIAESLRSAALDHC